MQNFNNFKFVKPFIDKKERGDKFKKIKDIIISIVIEEQENFISRKELLRKLHERKYKNNNNISKATDELIKKGFLIKTCHPELKTMHTIWYRIIHENIDEYYL